MLDATASEQQGRLIARIDEEQTLHGVDGAELIAPLSELARFYRAHGDAALAISAAQRALGIVRAKHGLNTLEQAPLILLQSEIEEGRGNVEEAWQLEQDLLQLARQNSGDLGTVTILQDFSDKRAGLLERYRNDDRKPPQVVLGCYYAGGPLQPHGATSCRSGSKQVATAALSDEADTYRAAAVRTIVHSDHYASGEVNELLSKAVDACRHYRGDPLDACKREVELVADLAYVVGTSVPQVDAQVRMADWQLLGVPWWQAPPRVSSAAPLVPGQLAPGSVPVSKPVEDCTGCSEALESYRRAYEELRRRGVEQAAIDRVFSPRLPVVLPASRDSVFVEPVGESGAYVDVAFEVTKQGRAVNAELRGATPGVSRERRFGVVHWIGELRFRPIMTDGQFVDAVPVVVRYPVSD
ncbi:MAG TPA: tetratricopeptide repeat protein [Gammaproteobacteria bacterium]|nr:tetratricopeptide repeat protein [Gammaproteobacteria bacterium]